MTSTVEGVVMEIDGSVAKVRVSRHDDCSACGACPGDTAIVMEAHSRLTVKVGQRVIVRIEGGKMVKSAFIVFVFPLLCLGAGCALGFGFSCLTLAPEVISEALGGILLLSASFLLIRRFDRSVGQKRSLPVIVELIQ